MIVPPGEFGTYAIHFTGSKEHNVAMRRRALGGDRILAVAAYDGAYVWLSRALGARLATLDVRVARVARAP